MNRLPTTCPFCEGAVVVRSFHCRQCDTTIEGHFVAEPTSEFEEDKLPILRRFAQLSSEQLQLLEAFIRSEGKLNRLQEEVKLSYPTLRTRLNQMTKDLGFAPQEEEEAVQLDRRQVLNDLETGKISADEAARLLRASRK